MSDAKTKIHPIIFGYFSDKDLPQELVETPLSRENYSENKKGTYHEFHSAKYTIITVALGESENYSKCVLEEVMNAVASRLPQTGIFIMDSFIINDRQIESMLETILLAVRKDDYRFNKYKTTACDTERRKISFFGTNNQRIEKAYKRASVIANNIDIAKDLGNEPSNKLTPKELAETLVDFAEEKELPYLRFSGREALEEIEAHALLAVNQGSSVAPELISIEYTGNPLSKETIGLVGKGITFDTGGYSLKPVTSIVDMKSDMCGAATLFAAFKSAVELELPINLVLVVASTDNVISRDAYKPDDVINTMNGKTVEIVSTDAEGRLILADALTFVQREYKVTEIIDAATLTGAAIMALGEDMAAVFSNNQAMYTSLEDVACRTNEPIWRLPLHRIYTDGVRRAPVADITNKPAATGGHASFAAAFLQEFIENDTPWIHLDIAAVAFYSSPKFGYKQGATGRMIPTVVKYLEKKKMK